MNCVKEPTGRWGGGWTEKKLDAFSKYVWSYLSIMKHSNWETIYFDGFAGSGSRAKDIHRNKSLFDELNISEESNVYKGSAERVLSLKDNLTFNYYYFIDTDKQALKTLRTKIKEKFGAPPKMIFRNDDVNNQLLKLSTTMKKYGEKYAALIFLDPFGMQIEWESIASLEGTRTDLWILLPTGVIVNRLLDKNGKLEYIEKLTSFFGFAEQEIRRVFYKKETEQTLFGKEEKITKVTKPIQKIAEFYVLQLKSIWKFVTDRPLVLLNSKNVPIYHFVFASNNKTAVRIARQIIQREN